MYDRAYWRDTKLRHGNVTPGLLAQYQAIAKGGVGAIVTGALFPFPPRVLGSRIRRALWPQRFPMILRGLRRWVEAVSDADAECRLIAQLNITGPWGPVDSMRHRIGRAPVVVQALDADQLEFLTRNFARAIERLERAGFDGVQLHAAHGYILSSFLSASNSRGDAYGGCAANRARVIREIVARARERVGDFPILIKMNCDDHVEGGTAIHNFAEVAREVQSSGVDAIEISGGSPNAGVLPSESTGFPPNPKPQARLHVVQSRRQSYYAAHAASFSARRVPLILTGGNRDPERLEELAQSGTADLFGMARALLCEPDLPRKWLIHDKPAKPECIACNSCHLGRYREQPYCLFKHDRRGFREVQAWIADYRRRVEG
jgi:2,4-dienoyl-CoA reductase-like NADH-dependent reductase (Old Yellow Enzyme family)